MYFAIHTVSVFMVLITLTVSQKTVTINNCTPCPRKTKPTAFGTQRWQIRLRRCNFWQATSWKCCV